MAREKFSDESVNKAIRESRILSDARAAVEDALYAIQKIRRNLNEAKGFKYLSGEVNNDMINLEGSLELFQEMRKATREGK